MMELVRRRGRAAHLSEDEAEEERQREYDNGDHNEDENQEHVKVEPALQLLLRRQTVGLRRVGPCRRIVKTNNTSNNDRSHTESQGICSSAHADARTRFVVAERQGI
jgi:hypothetical protein